MPWKNESPMEQKRRFINLAQSGHFTVTELCQEFGITRKTGHKWLGRYAACGMEGLEERSRAPRSVACRTCEEVERLIVSEKRLHLSWGPKKIQRVLMVKHGMERPPVVSTVGEVLKRHGMVEARKRRGAVFKVERGSLTVPERCNHVLGVDFKGWFLTGDGERCDPLTVTDLHSRYLLRAEGLPQATTRWTQGGLPRIVPPPRRARDHPGGQRGALRGDESRRAKQVERVVDRAGDRGAVYASRVPPGQRVSRTDAPDDESRVLHATERQSVGATAAL